MNNISSVYLLLERIEEYVKFINKDLSKIKDYINDEIPIKPQQTYPWNKEKDYE